MKHSLPQLARALREGQVSSEALTETAIAKHQQCNQSLTAYKTWAPEQALLQARAADSAFAAQCDLGPLQGLPVSVKDLYAIQGYPTYAGTPQRLPERWEQEGPLVKKLRQQLSVITGKTHTVEFAFGGLGINPHWQTPRNPWDSQQHRIPGGSSAGAGVSLACGSALLALGTDTAGSIRIPASMTGQVGLKTSCGRWSTQGIVPLSPSLDTPGLLTRTVEDMQFAFNALDQASPNEHTESVDTLTGLRIGISDGLMWDDCSPGITEGVHEALDELVNQGARKLAWILPEAEQIYPIFKQGGLAATDLYVFLQAELPDWIPILDEKITQRMHEASTLPAAEYLHRLRLFKSLSQQADQRLQNIDVLITPTVAITPPAIQDISEQDAYCQANLLSLRNTGIVNYLNLCALTLPVALDHQGLPVGMQLIMRHGQEQALLAIARAFERILGNTGQRLGSSPLGVSL